MEWLSRGIEVLIDKIRSGQDQAGRFDVVVVGSGYGGSVAAARLAGAEKSHGRHVSLCLLERGKEYLPGEFPNHMRDFPGHVRVDQHDKQEIYGRPEALFDYRSNPDVNVLVGNALGGGSQINAAVALEAGAEVFGCDAWPIEFHADPKYLATWYAKAKSMLGVSDFPDSDQNPKLPKLAALKELADSYSRWPYTAPSYTFPELRHYMNGQPIIGRGVPKPRAQRRSPEFRRLPLAISFDGENDHGVKQNACLKCGDCCSGCNYWAKNTLTMNYLPLARRRGAKIYTGAKVLRVARAEATAGRRWRVEFIRAAFEKERSAYETQEREAKSSSDAAEGKAATAVHCVYADVVILAAGTLGSTEILLRSRKEQEGADRDEQTPASKPQAGDERLSLSPCVGTRFSCNGDMIAVGYGQSKPVHPVGCGAGDPDPNKRRYQTGPMAAGMIDFRKRDNEGCPLIIEDGAIPGALKRLYGEIITTAGMIAQFTENDLKDDGKTDPLAVSEHLVDCSQVYLMMGLDSANGRLHLDQPPTPFPHDHASKIKRSGISIDWRDAATEPVYKAQKKLLEQVRALGGIPLMSTLWEILPEKLTWVLEGKPPDSKLITVHPLGGCPMGETMYSGAVDHIGQVFDGCDATSVHQGLFVCDGSIIPSALAVNPLLTITALAERNVEILAKRYEWRIDSAELSALPALPQRIPGPYREESPRPVAVTLREQLEGVLRDLEPGAVAKAFGTKRRDPQAQRGRATFVRGHDVGPLANADDEHDIVFDLRAPISDLDRFLQHPDHASDSIHIERLSADDQDVYLCESDMAQARCIKPSVGSFQLLRREDSTREQRIFRALRHWWPTRGFASTIIRDNPKLEPLLEKLLKKDSDRYGNEAEGFDVSVYRFGRLGLPLLLDRLGSKHSSPKEPEESDEEKILGMLRVANHAGERRRFRYALPFKGADGEQYELRGEKLLRYARVETFTCDENNNPWRSIARLSAMLVRRRGEHESEVANGELWFDFVDMARNTQRWPQVVSDTDAPSAFLALASLALFFARVLIQVYFWTFRVPYDLKDKKDQKDAKECPSPNQYAAAAPVSGDRSVIRTSDNPAEVRPAATLWPDSFTGIEGPVYYWSEPRERIWRRVCPSDAGLSVARKEAALLLTRYPGVKGEATEARGKREPVILIPGFAHSTRIFALPTLTTNLVQYLVERGFDVWLLDPRTSSGLNSSWDQHELGATALEDIDAALKKIRLECASPDGKRVPQIAVVAHCMGAAMFMLWALNDKNILDDEIPASRAGWIKSAVLSQVGPVAVGSPANNFRAEFLAMLRDQLGRDHVDCRVTQADASSMDVIADGLAATYPLRADVVGDHLPQCGNPRGFEIAVCNRITALYGHNWKHANLNPATHKQLGEILGNANIKTFEQLVHFVQHNRLTDTDGENRYVTFKHIIRNLDFPIALIQGAGNDVFSRESSRRSYLLLKRIGRYSGRRARRITENLQNLTLRNISADKVGGLKELFSKAIRLPQAIDSARLRRQSNPQTMTTTLTAAALSELHPVVRARLEAAKVSGAVLQGFSSRAARAERLLHHQQIRNNDRWKWIKNYVHLDCIIGQRADTDVYPYIGDFLRGQSRDDWDHEEPDRTEQDLWWWVSSPRAGPILGWTQVDNGKLRARVWSMPDDDSPRADDRVEPAAVIHAESKTIAGWGFLNRYKLAKMMFEEVALAEIEVDADTTNGVELRFVGQHALPRLTEKAASARDEVIDDDDDGRADEDDLPSPSPRGSQIESSLRRWRRSVTPEAQKRLLEQCEVRISAKLIAALGQSDGMAFLFGSCRYPATGFLSEYGDRIFAIVKAESEREQQGVYPSALLMLGDQIYYDATAEIFDTEKARAKFEQRYVDAFQGKYFRDLVRRIPTYMGVDDHEIFEAWEPAIENTQKRENTKKWGIQAYKCFQQLHGPCNGTSQKDSNGLWYFFDQCGFPFFVMDARTERKRDARDPCSLKANIISGEQMKALEAFLFKAQDQKEVREKTRPKFVASSSVLAPALRKSASHPAYAIRDDSWAGFPTSRAQLLGIIAKNKIENVVFLSGDVHCSMVAELTYEGVSVRGAPLKSYCITASPFYSPYPFINHTRYDFEPTDTFETDEGIKVRYETCRDSWVERDSFSRVDVARAENGRWQLDISAFGRDEKEKPTRTSLELR